MYYMEKRLRRQAIFGNMTSDILSLIKKYPYKIAVNVGFKDIKEYPHNEWMQNILYGNGDYTLMAHRGSYKSSCLSVCIALIMVLYPQDNIIFLRKADNDVSEMVRMVIKALESNFVKDLAHVLYGINLKILESSQSAVTTNLFLSASGASQLIGIGLKSSITGKHANIVITDDICNVSDRISKAERERTKIQYQELQNICNRGGRIINLGTKWHKDDVFNLMKNINTYDYKATQLISDTDIAELKDSMLPSLFACNYELKIIASEDVIFTNPVTGGDPAKVQQSNYCHIDAAYNGEDSTAFTICRKTEGKYYVFGKLWRKHVDDCEDEIIGYRKSFNAGKIYCETNADKGYLAKDLRSRGERVVDYPETTNKFIKITSYLKAEWRNIVFVEGTDAEYIEQITEYNENADHDDAPDSLASIIRVLWGKQGEDNQYKPIIFNR